MAMKTLRVRVCDVCGSEQGVCRWRVARLEADVRTVTLDLCEEHSAPLLPLLEVKAEDKRRKKVTPISEVVAQKKTPARKRASTKKAAAARR